ncbi:hypothetical protein Tco_1021757 [Tanacetum coccineum]
MVTSMGICHAKPYTLRGGPSTKLEQRLFKAWQLNNHSKNSSISSKPDRAHICTITSIFVKLNEIGYLFARMTSLYYLVSCIFPASAMMLMVSGYMFDGCNILALVSYLGILTQYDSIDCVGSGCDYVHHTFGDDDCCLHYGLLNCRCPSSSSGGAATEACGCSHGLYLVLSVALCCIAVVPEVELLFCLNMKAD